MDEAARLKAEKKARKEEKRQKKAAAAAAAVATSVEESTLEPTAATEPEVAADEALKAKKEKKERKKRKREAEAAANGNPAEDAAAVAENINADEEPVAEEKTKKKRKKNVKGAFGNDPSKAPNGHAASAPAPTPATNGSSKISSIPSIPQSEIDQFQTSNNVSYDPPTAPSEYAPILAFDQLPVAQGIKDGLKSFSKPTTVQSASWGVQLRTSKTARARDCVSIAATGSGKTLAFGIPILHQILSSPPSSSVTALVVAPTRELAMQTQNNLGVLGETLKIGVVCIYGGESKQKQIGLLKQKPKIVVGTPGRIIDLCNEGALNLNAVSWLVLDEADRMLDKGFENDIRNIIAQCKQSSADANGRITSMFSATWPMSVRRLAGDFMIDPIRITVGSDELSANTSVSQSVIVLQDGREKDRKLLDVLRQQGYPPPGRAGGGGWGGKPKSPAAATGAQRDKVLVFALYKKEAARVATWLERQGYEVGCIQGDLSQDKRTQALEDFKTGTTGILVATDVAARGLDIPKVELVINYTFPLTVEDYVHRIGRTGRAGRTGISVTFFTENEKALAGELQKVLRDAGQEIPEALAAFGGTIKKRSHAAYGDHFREIDPNIKATKITFDD